MMWGETDTETDVLRGRTPHDRADPRLRRLLVLLPESEGKGRAATRRACPNSSSSLARGTCRRRRRASAAAKTTTTDPRAQTLALRPRLGLVLWGLAGLEERPERNVVLPPQLTALLAPGPRGLARVDDGRAGLHLLVLSVGETRRLAIHTSNLKHVPRRRRRLPSQMRRPRPRDPLRAHRSRAETGARRSPAYRRGYVR